MKPIVTRTISGAIYILAVLASVFAGRISFGAVMLLFLLLCQYEYINMFRHAGISIDKISFYISGMLSYVTGWLVITGNLNEKFLFIIIPMTFLPFITELMRQEKQPVSNLTYGIAGLVYLVVPFVLLNSFYYPETAEFTRYNYSLLFGFFIIIWAYDTFAYLSGMFFGKHKFFERISPKKTWEGTAGGLVFGIAGGAILSLFYSDHSLIEWMGFAAVIIIFGIFGDLFESLIKRSLGLKDSGRIMPGHGGILDRFDSILLAAPFAFIYKVFVLI